MITTEFYYEEINTPVGLLLIIGLNDCILRIEFGTKRELDDKLVKWFGRFYKNPVFIKNTSIYSHVKNELDEYFSNKRKHFTFKFNLLGTPFQQQVWKTLYQTTKYGETKTYQDLAIAINHPKAVRAIGGAMNKNPISIVVPCHRIIGKSGQLVGYGGGINKKQFLLDLEQQG